MPGKVNKKQTGKKVAHMAAKGLENSKTPKTQRSIDASAVGQAPFKKKAATKKTQSKKKR